MPAVPDARPSLWVDPRLQAAHRPWRKIHLDFHNTPAVGAVGDGFDPDAFVRTLREAHVDAVVVFAKDMHGWFYYPAARSDAVHPGLTLDLLGAQVEACRAAGIRVHAYYCTTWDNEVAEAHPEWLVVKRDRSTYLPAFDQTPGWTALCLRHEGFVQQMLDDTADLVSRYPVDGVWYDMPFPIDGECYCHACLVALRAAGLDPLDPEVQRADKQWLWAEWQRRSAELVERLRPGCEIDQNNNTRIGLAQRLGADRSPDGRPDGGPDRWLSNVDIEALPTGGWGYQYFPVAVRYARTHGTPVTGLTGRFVQAWADFGGLKPPDQLVVEVAAIVAQGAQAGVGDQAVPSGRLDPAVYATIAPAFGWLAARQPDLEGGAPVVEAAVLAAGPLLADPARLALPGLPIEADVRWSHGVVGAADLLTAHRVQFDVAEPAELDRYRLLVVPDTTVVDPDLAARLNAHLDRGGAVIALGDGLRTGEGCWPPGVSWAGPAPYSTAYLVPTEAADGLPAFPYALYGGTGRFRADPGATVLALVGEPLFERTPEHYTSHSYAPFRAVTEHPAAWHTAGSGRRFAAMGFGAGTAYLDTGYWIYADLFGRLLDAVLPDRLVSTDLPDAVEVSLTRRSRPDGGTAATLVHLVPAFTARRWGTRPAGYPRQPVLTDAAVSLLLDHPVSSARVSGTGEPVELGRDGDRTTITLPRLDGPTVVVLEG